MLRLNKYLRELGINEKSWPFNEIIENTELYNKGEDCDTRYVEDCKLKDGTINEGFIDATTFSMDNTLSMIIYSYLCYFRENCAIHATPSYFCNKINKQGQIVDRENGHEKWLETIDAMIEAFKLLILEDERNDYGTKEYKEHSRRRQKKINYGMRQFIKHYNALWW